MIHPRKGFAARDVGDFGLGVGLEYDRTRRIDQEFQQHDEKRHEQSGLVPHCRHHRQGNDQPMQREKEARSFQRGVLA